MSPAEVDDIEALFAEYEALLAVKAVVPLSERVFDVPVELYGRNGARTTLATRQAIVDALNTSLEEPRSDDRRITSEVSQVQLLNAHTATACVTYRAPIGSVGEVELRRWFYLLQKKAGGTWRICVLVARDAARIAPDP